MMLKIDSFCDAIENSITYLLTYNNRAIVIDPSNNVNTLKKYIDDKTLDGIFITHGHYDHYKSIVELNSIYNAPIYLTKKAFEKLNNINDSCAVMFGCYCITDISKFNIHYINDNEIIKFDSITIKVLFTPGHTNCSATYLIEDALFSGDLLFETSVGRWDLPTGSYPALKNSLERIKKLDTNITVYPGHDESFKLLDAVKYNKYLQ